MMEIMCVFKKIFTIKIISILLNAFYVIHIHFKTFPNGYQCARVKFTETLHELDLEASPK